MIAANEPVPAYSQLAVCPRRLLTTPQAAKLLGVSVGFLARDRWLGPKIPFIRISPRLVRYRVEDLLEFMDRNTHGPGERK